MVLNLRGWACPQQFPQWSPFAPACTANRFVSMATKPGDESAILRELSPGGGRYDVISVVSRAAECHIRVCRLIAFLQIVRLYFLAGTAWMSFSRSRSSAIPSKGITTTLLP